MPYLAWFVVLLALSSCTSTPADSSPPNLLRPAPEAPAPPPAPAPVDPLPTGVEPPAAKAPGAHEQPVRAAREVEREVAPTRSAATEPAPGAEPAKTSVRVPESPHVKVEVPKGLQALLDDDPRMVPWLARTMATIDRCQAKNPRAAGSVAIVVTMHENARPTPKLGAVPAALEGLAACALEDFMQAERMPLFTGPEGQQHTLQLRVVP